MKLLSREISARSISAQRRTDHKRTRPALHVKLSTIRAVLTIQIPLSNEKLFRMCSSLSKAETSHFFPFVATSNATKGKMLRKRNERFFFFLKDLDFDGELKVADTTFDNGELFPYKTNSLSQHNFPCA